MFPLFKKQQQEEVDDLPILVFPEATNPLVLKAAAVLHKKQKAAILLIGNKKDIEKAAEENKVKLEGISIRDPAADDSFEEAGNTLYSLNEKSMDLTAAKELALEPVYFAYYLLRSKQAHGIVLGASLSGQEIFKPALQTFPENMRNVSSFNILTKQNYTIMFADCSMNANPTPDRLAEIAMQSARSAKELSLNPKVALLSFSTKGSSQHIDAEKVRDAVESLEGFKIPFDGELQFDVAINPDVAKRKGIGGDVAGHANVLIFPDLDSGNIAVKVAENLAGFEVLGPFVQGLPAPIGTLSDACDVDEIYETAQIVALLARKVLNSANTEKEEDGDSEEENEHEEEGKEEEQHDAGSEGDAEESGQDESREHS
ncbi:MAG: phosphate acyltransferase [Candidatus Woesearchaeota archaeon]